MFIKRIEYQREKIIDQNIYPYNIACLKDFDILEFRSPVTFLIGENGSGKSTLIEALAISLGMNAEGGTNNFDFITKNTNSSLHQLLKIVKTPNVPKTKFFLRAESFYNLATYLDEDELRPILRKYYGGKSLHEQSHGESFMAVMKTRFGGNGLYILDEPEAALSPTSQMSLLILIKQLVEKGSQFIIATHSPILLAFPNAEIYDLEHQFLSCNYEETKYYQLYKLFLNEKERMLNQLFKEEIE